MYHYYLNNRSLFCSLHWNTSSSLGHMVIIVTIIISVSFILSSSFLLLPFIPSSFLLLPFIFLEQASVEAPLSARCNSLKRWKLVSVVITGSYSFNYLFQYITIPRVIMIFIGIVSLSLFVAIEIVFSTTKSK